MDIDINDVELVADQSQLILSDAEKDQALKDLTDMIGHAEKLSELDLDDVEPTIRVLSIVNKFREDDVCPSMDREVILKNALHVTEDSFVVPKIVE